MAGQQPEPGDAPTNSTPHAVRKGLAMEAPTCHRTKTNEKRRPRVSMHETVLAEPRGCSLPSYSPAGKSRQVQLPGWDTLSAENSRTARAVSLLSRHSLHGH